VEHDFALTFQAPFEAKLLRPLVRRLMTPLVAGVCAAGLPVALLIELAGDRSLAAAVAGGSVLTALILPFHFGSEVAKRSAPKSGNMIAYRIDHAGIQTLAGFAAHTLTWPEITRVEQRRDQVALYYGRRSVQSIPTGTLTTGQRAQLQQFLRARETNVAGPAASGRSS
jgi:hypothetical protein